MLPDQRGEDPILREAAQGPHVLQALHAEAGVHEDEERSLVEGSGQQVHVRASHREDETAS